MASKFNVPRRRWGKSNIQIPVIPFGTQGFGNNFGFVSDDDACKLIRVDVMLTFNDYNLVNYPRLKSVGFLLQ